MYKYLSLKEALEVHRLTVEYSGGGLSGVLDASRLDSVLTSIQNDDYYPELVDKLTHLLFCAAKFHCFEDCNKRVALTLCVKFLVENDYIKIAKKFMRANEDVVYKVASGEIEKEELRERLSNFLKNN